MKGGVGFDFSKIKPINLAEFMSRPQVSYDFQKPVRPYNPSVGNYASRVHNYAPNKTYVG